jgi:DNA-binding response OmpR family regulator
VRTVPRLLVVDDSEPVGRALARIAGALGWDADVATAWSQAQLLLRRTDYQFLLVDYGLGGATGAEVIGWARRLRPALPAALMSGSEAAGSAATEIGCPLLLKPFSRDAFAALLEAAARTAATGGNGDVHCARKETPA